MNLSDLLETAVWKSKQMLIERCFQAKDLSLDDTSQAIGLSAVKYSDLNRHRNSNISFDVNAMLDFKGNTSVYLQYTRCRACKLLRDLNFESMNLKLDSNISDQECDDHERNLCVAILGYADALNEAASRLEPHIFCHYLYSLASSINSFYSQCPIIGNERQVIRARILQLAVRRLEDGFKILGLATIDHM